METVNDLDTDEHDGEGILDRRDVGDRVSGELVEEPHQHGDGADRRENLDPPGWSGSGLVGEDHSGNDQGCAEENGRLSDLVFGTGGHD
jgi:hypothetical protein